VASEFADHCALFSQAFAHLRSIRACAFYGSCLRCLRLRRFSPSHFLLLPISWSWRPERTFKRTPSAGQIPKSAQTSVYLLIPSCYFRGDKSFVDDLTESSVVVQGLCQYPLRFTLSSSDLFIYSTACRSRCVTGCLRPSACHGFDFSIDSDG
jgi:hypothetical protein